MCHAKTWKNEVERAENHQIEDARQIELADHLMNECKHLQSLPIQPKGELIEKVFSFDPKFDLSKIRLEKQVIEQVTAINVTVSTSMIELADLIISGDTQAKYSKEQLKMIHGQLEKAQKHLDTISKTIDDDSQN